MNNTTPKLVKDFEKLAKSLKEAGYGATAKILMGLKEVFINESETEIQKKHQ